MSSIKLTSDTLAVSPAGGEIEYNGKIFTATPQDNTQRGIIPTEQFYRLNSTVVGANSTGAQNTFGVGVTLAGSTVYEFEYLMIISKSAGANSHNISLGVGGTATVNNIAYVMNGGYVLSATPSGQLTISTNNGYASVANSTSPTVFATSYSAAAITLAIWVKGTVSINAGGTFIPQYTLSAAPGGAYSTQPGSYIKIKPVGASGSVVSVGTWS